jgi:predicted nuclease with RNAse H fold
MYNTNDEIIEAIINDNPKLIGIDSPLSLPEGLCCLNEECSCQPASMKKGRQCERDLSKEGIGSYYTTKKSFIKSMIIRAVELKNSLESQDFEVKEVYPYASKVRLWGKSIPKKTTIQGRDFLSKNLCSITSNIGEYGELTHDQYDAVIAAYTVYLLHMGEADLIGDPGEGQIVMPRRFVAEYLTRRV